MNYHVASCGHSGSTATRCSAPDLMRELRATDDHLWATSDFEVLDVRCRLTEGTAAGSDHPLLLADLAL